MSKSCQLDREKQLQQRGKRGRVRGGKKIHEIITLE